MKIKLEMGFIKTSKNNQYYPSGELLATYSTGPDSLAEGEYIEYYRSGSVQAFGNFHNGRKEGEWTFYHEDGSLQANGKFINGYKFDIWKYNVNKLPKTFYWGVYKHAEGFYGINYPLSWQIQERNDVNLFAAFEPVPSGQFGANFSVVRNELQHPVNLAEYAIGNVNYQVRKQVQKIEIVLILSDRLNINELEARYSVMKTENEIHQPIYFIQFHILNGLQLFIINFFCLEARVSEIEKIFDEIIYSFRSPY